MKSRPGSIGALAAVLTLASTAASGATADAPTAPTYAPAPESPPGTANFAMPIPGVVLDDRGNPLPPCREHGPNGILVIRGTGCVP
jgi:hypothetical protein